MLLSCLIVVIVGNGMVGGSGMVFRESYEAGRIEIFNLDLSPLTRHTFWSQVGYNKKEIMLVINLNLFNVTCYKFPGNLSCS